MHASTAALSSFIHRLFTVVTNNESAEYGRSCGATINVASNSGQTNGNIR